MNASKIEYVPNSMGSAHVVSEVSITEFGLWATSIADLRIDGYWHVLAAHTLGTHGQPMRVFFHAPTLSWRVFIRGA